jgi:hypothetical protein
MMIGGATFNVATICNRILSFENSFCLHTLKHFQVSFENKSFMNIVKNIIACCSPTTFIFFNVVVALFDVAQMCALITPSLPTS